MNYHTKKKKNTKQSALHTDLVNRHTNFFYFAKFFNPHTKFDNFKFKKNLHTKLNFKIEIICSIYAFIKVYKIIYISVCFSHHALSKYVKIFEKFYSIIRDIAILSELYMEFGKKHCFYCV